MYRSARASPLAIPSLEEINTPARFPILPSHDTHESDIENASLLGHAPGRLGGSQKHHRQYPIHSLNAALTGILQIGLETIEEGSKSISVPLGDCHNLDS